MKICIISKTDKTGGGASKYAHFLVESYRKAGYQADHIHLKTLKENSNPIIYKLKMVFRLFEKKVLGLPDYFSLWYRKLKDIVSDYDLIHVHDISSAFSLRTVQKLGQLKSLVWTMHDCSIFTAGCLYPMECIKYKTKCKNCPQRKWPIDGPWVKTAFLKTWKSKLNLSHITFTSPSYWLTQKAALASGFRNSIIHIPNSVDTNLYYSERQKTNDNPISILISACNLADSRKGADIALSVIQKLDPNEVNVLVLGKADDTFSSELSEYNVSYFGFISDEEKIRTIYNQADIFLFPSRADNQPLSILESLSCGTPVVSCNIGGIPEIIQNGKTGLLYETHDINGMAEGIRHIKMNISTYSVNARNYIMEYHKESYKMSLDLYNDLLL